MTRISKIGRALNEINDAVFQELCNKFLFYKYDYKNINQKGSVVGKEKTRKGTPDTIFIDKDDKYIFAEYTTKERIGKSKSFFEKIESDIKDCFNIDKAKINNDKVSKVISCHTEKLDLTEIEELTQLCKSYNENCVFEQYGIDDLSIQLEAYPSLLETYLGIKVGTGQIMKLPEYINYYEKPDLRIATPLSNVFYGREKEFEEGLSFLNDANLLLVTGASGIGKTKFAIELCKKYIDDNTSYNLLCFANKNIEAYEDLQTHLSVDKDYIILVDDANRAMGNYNFILLLLRSDRTGRIKIVTTVRDYAKDMIEKVSWDYNFNTLALDIVSNEDITIILKSIDFNIQNQKYLDKIILIARGNLRLAIMCAIIAVKENTLSSLDDVSQLYEHYFNDIYQKIIAKDKYNSLKVLGIISFFRIISKERTELNNRIFTTFSISEDLFWEQCLELNQLEIVDLYENEIVKISDQILSAYLCYKIFFDEKILDFGLLIRDFIDSETKFYETINPLIAAFNHKNITDELTLILKRDWDIITKESDYNHIIKIGKIFWFCLGNRLLSHFYDYITLIPEPESREFIVDYKHNDMALNSSSDILSILSKFKRFYDDRAKSALELMFLFVEKKPEQSQRLSYLLKEHWMITRYDYDIELYAQHQLIDFLISKIKEKKEIELYTRFFFKIASDLLETTFHENASTGNQITMYTIKISLTDDIKRLRVKIWEFLWSLYTKEKDAFHKLLYNLGKASHGSANDIWAFDYEILSSYLSKLDYTEYRACEATAWFLRQLRWNNIEYDKSIEDIATNRLFKLNQLLTERIDREDWREEESKKRVELLAYCKDYKFEDYINLFNDIEELKAIKRESDQNYFYPLSTIISGIVTKDSDLFVNILLHYIENYPSRLWSNSILQKYFMSAPTNYEYLFSRLSTSEVARTKIWMLEYHEAIPIECLDKASNKMLLNLYETLAILEGITISRIEAIIDKYKIYEAKEVICHKFLNIFLNNEQLYLEEGTLKYILTETKDYATCQILYLRSNGYEQYFDFDQELFLKFLKQDSSFFLRFLNSIYNKNKKSHDYSSEKFSKIWQLDNYREVALLGIDYFKENGFGLYSRDIPTMFFMQLGEYENRALSFIEEMIDKYYSDSGYMEIIFNIIAHSFTQYRNQFLKQLLQLTQNYEIFRAINLFPLGMTASGSWIPIYERRMKDWESILEAVKSLDMGIKLIKHIKNIEDEISSCKKRIKYEAKRDFLEQFDS